MMGSILYQYSRALKVVTVALLAIMVTLVFANVVLRYAFNSGITISEELSRWLFIWLTFLDSIYALRENRHLGTDVLVSRLGPRMQLASLLVGHGFMLWVCWLLFAGAYAQTRLNWNVTAPSTGFSLAWFYMSGVVFSVSAALILVERMIGLLRDGVPVPPAGGSEP
jgi:TRAP-type C4-dicarboxylate transport system permease small subunit